MLALFNLIPIKDWLYTAIIAGLISFGVYERSHLITEGEREQEARVTAASVKAQAAAEAKITALNAAHAQNVAQIQAAYETQHQNDTAAHAADLERLREYDAYRNASTHVDSASPGPSATSGGNGGAISVGDSLSRLEQVSSDLADSLRNTSAALDACKSDRESLTGK